jgi:hypothetical protein
MVNPMSPAPSSVVITISVVCLPWCLQELERQGVLEKGALLTFVPWRIQRLFGVNIIELYG